MKKLLLFISLLASTFELAKGQTVYCVTNNLDSGPGSLRYEISIAGSGNIVDMSAVTGQTIALASPISIPNTVTINGYNSIVSGNSSVGIFNISGTKVTLNNLTLTKGYNSVGGGGAIYVSGSVLNVNNTTIVNNTSTGTNNRGGGIYITNNAVVNLVASTVSGNTAIGAEGGGISLEGNTAGAINSYLSIISNNQVLGGKNGGGIDSDAGGSITLISTLIANNTSSLGGGISSVGNLIQIINSIVYGNVSNGSGGGVNTGAITLIQNSSFVGNVALGGDGAAFYSYGALLTIASSLIVGNTASGTNTGGIYGSCINIELDNTIFSSNLANGVPKDIQNGSCGINSTYGHNLFNTYTSVSNFVFASGANITGNGTITGVTNIVSNTLANNGGPLPTLSIPATSSAVGWGVWPTTVKVDGRGYIRSCANDAGAFQIQRFSTLNLTPKINTLCGQSLPLTLNAGATTANGSFVWYFNGSSISGANTSTYNITTYTAGTYKVRVYTSATCYQEDSIVVVAALPPTTISPRSSAQCAQTSVSLCNPSSVNLSATTTGPGLTYLWKYAALPAPGYAGLSNVTAGGTNVTLPNINTPGIYQVTVSALGCASVSDTISLKSVTASPINYTTCPAPNTVVGLSVTGSGKYKWYTAATGGTVVGVGNSIITKIPLTATTSPIIYYVTDTSSFTGEVGPTNPSGLTAATYGASNALVNFTVNHDFTITSMQVPLGFYSPTPSGGTNVTITIEIKDGSGNSFSPVKTFVSNPTPVIAGQTTGLFTFSFTGLNIYASWGSNLTMAANSISYTNGAGGYIAWYSSGTTSYPYVSVPSGPAVITGASGPYGIVYGSFINWQIQTGSQCARVPVIAQVVCSLSSNELQFEAMADDNKVDITWSDIRQTDLLHYVIEKSKDGTSFNEFKEIAPNGPINKNVNYSTVDFAPYQGQSYYRLKSTNVDGSFNYSEIKSVVIGNIALSANLFPNPTSGDVNLNVIYNGTDDLQVQINNTVGQSLFSNLYSGGSQNFSTLLPTSVYPKGLYIVKIATSTEEKVIKLALE